MLEGPLFKNIIVYTVPIILTGVLQLLFNAADLIVVGRYEGSLSVAAVGATSSIIHLLTNFFIGISVGAGICAAHSVGAGDDNYLSKTVHTVIPSAIICGIFLTVVGVFGTDFFLRLIDTPENILPLSAVYMKIYFAGITATMVYNFGAAILRAVGDTKSPLIFLTLSGVLNVALNLIFVIFLEIGVAGVALATTISQFVSAILVVFALMRRNDGAKLVIKKIQISNTILKKMISIGIPAGIQSSMFSFSNVIIQSTINSFGEIAVSGSSASNNIEGFVYVMLNAFHQTTLNFTGQNVGAKNYTRVSKVYKQCLACACVFGLCLGGLVLTFGESLLSIYITDSAQAIRYGIVRLTIISSAHFICGMMDVTTGAIRGLGVSIPPMIISIIGICGIRLLWIYTVFQIPKFHTFNTLFFSYPVSWLVTFILQLTVYIILYKRRKHNII